MVARFELLIGIALSVIAVVIPTFLPYAVLVQIALIVSTARSTPRSTIVRTLDLPMLLLCIIAATNLLVALFPEITTPQVLRLLNGMALFRAALRLPTDVRHGFAEKMLLGLGVTSAASSLLLITAYLLPDMLGSVTNADGPILSGFLLTISIGVIVKLRATELSRSLKIVHLTAGALGIAVLVTQGITIVPIVLAIAVVTALIAPNPQRLRILVPASVIAFVIIRVALGTAPLAWVTVLFGLQRSEDLVMLREIWNRAWRIVIDFPFTGVGMGAFGPVVDALYPLYSAPQARETRSAVLQIMTDLGIPGIVVISVIGLQTCRIVGRALLSTASTAAHDAQNKANFILMSSAVTAQMLLMFAGFGAAPMWGAAWSAPLVWLLWGAAVPIASARPPTAVDDSRE